jgi:hypothetical protein
LSKSDLFTVHACTGHGGMVLRRLTGKTRAKIHKKRPNSLLAFSKENGDILTV